MRLSACINLCTINMCDIYSNNFSINISFYLNTCKNTCQLFTSLVAGAFSIISPVFLSLCPDQLRLTSDLGCWTPWIVSCGSFCQKFSDAFNVFFCFLIMIIQKWIHPFRLFIPNKTMTQDELQTYLFYRIYTSKLPVCLANDVFCEQNYRNQQMTKAKKIKGKIKKKRSWERDY